ncbi:myosin heavy chain kinase B-like protein [Cinnamomum micranthum f. kanehirae]|uniref:Myosin heavy chain kinase B-like protein n=1 Tax=Cinnamomum micranthum f. kanehirae TaxID=337451 RepID=A0A3S3MMX5_9MAGN|nr:myosin heavy chain kinase B-like protein [Cinnamomum micranthum f. kanehirae]
MEFFSKRSSWSYIDEDQRPLHSSADLSFKTHQGIYETEPPMSPARPSSASMVSFAPSSPESTWAFSPQHHHQPPSPSPTLLCYCLASLHRHHGSVYSIAISKGAVFTGSDSKRIRVWRQSECIERGHIKAKSGHVNVILAFGNTLFTTHKDRKVRVWAFSATDHFRSKKLATLPQKARPLSFPRVQPQQHKDVITCMAFYNAEALLYTGSRDKTVKVWRLTNKKCVDSFIAHEDRVNAILVNQGDGCVFTCSSDGLVKIWRRVYGESSHTLTISLSFQPSPVNALALSSSYKSCNLYSGSSDGLINFWEKEDDGGGRYSHGGFLQGHRFAVICLETIDKVVLSGSEDTTIRMWRREEESGFHVCLAVLEGHRGPVKCLSACVEMEKVVVGYLVYSAGTDRTVKVWSIKLFPGEKKVMVVDDEEKDEDDEIDMKKRMCYEMSPVLSPSWVHRKRQ